MATFLLGREVSREDLDKLMALVRVLEYDVQFQQLDGLKNHLSIEIKRVLASDP